MNVERNDQTIWDEAKARHEAGDNKVRPWFAKAIKRERDSYTAVALTDDERKLLYDAIASERAGKEKI